MSRCHLVTTVATAMALAMGGFPTVVWAAEPAPEAEVEASSSPPSAPDPSDADADAEAEDGGVTELGAVEPDDGLVLDQAAADRENARLAYREGSDLYELGKYPEAIEHFQRAWELSKEIQLLYNIGQAYWKWYDVDPEVDHLRQAAVFFRNYNKRQRLTEEYDPTEIDNILKAIDAQIEVDERKKAEANRPVLVQPGGLSEEELAWEQRRRATRGLVISGTTITVLGALTLAAGVGGVLSRVTHRFILDSSTGSEGGVNLATAEEDARRRNGFLLSGRIGFGTLIAAAVVLPVGIGLRIAGGVRQKKDRAHARELDEKRERNKAKAKIAIQPSLGGLTVRF